MKKQIKEIMAELADASLAVARLNAVYDFEKNRRREALSALYRAHKKAQAVLEEAKDE